VPAAKGLRQGAKEQGSGNQICEIEIISVQDVFSHIPEISSSSQSIKHLASKFFDGGR
jgi:hypothetical protein